MRAIISSGIKHRLAGAHAARTMMLAELDALLCSVGTAPQSRECYRIAIVEKNCLGKRSAKSRVLSYRHLVDLYGLDSAQLVFAGLLRFWNQDASANPLIALCAALARDALLARFAPFVWQFAPGTALSRVVLEEQIERVVPERFSPATRKSIAQNIRSTLTQSGHLSGRVNKYRQQADPGPASMAYALFLSYIEGARGPELFRTPYVLAQDIPTEQAIQFAELAARRGWLQFKRVGDVMEVSFPQLLAGTDLEALRE